MPESEDRSKKKAFVKAGFVATLVAYVAVAWFAFNMAVATHTPCTTNFEGGCGYAKVWAGALSWLAAGVAVWPAVGIGLFSFFMPRLKAILVTVSVILAVPPLAYVLYGLYAVAPSLLRLMA